MPTVLGHRGLTVSEAWVGPLISASCLFPSAKPSHGHPVAHVLLSVQPAHGCSTQGSWSGLGPHRPLRRGSSSYLGRDFELQTCSVKSDDLAGMGVGARGQLHAGRAPCRLPEGPADGARGSREVLCVACHHRLRPRPRHVPCAPPTNAAPHPPISGDRRGNLCKPMSPRPVWRDALSVHRRGACSRRPRRRRWSPPTASCRCALVPASRERGAGSAVVLQARDKDIRETRKALVMCQEQS